MEESSSEDHSTSFVTEPGENNGREFPQTPTKKKKRKRKRKRKVKSKAENSQVMSQLVAVRQNKKQSLFSLINKPESQINLWDMSAQTLLNMTLTFLRHVPEVNK